MARVLISAGFDGALHAIAIAELLRRARQQVAGVLVVSPFGVSRARAMLRQRGLSGLIRTARRLWAADPSDDAATDAMARLLRENEIPERSLRTWARRHDVPFHSVSSLNDDESIDIAEHAEADGLVYAGGGILRRRVLEVLDGRVLNAHMGPLPEVRGMNACEWSLLLGISPAVTIHFIERGIDTGPVVEVCPVAVKAGDTLERLKARCTAVGVEGLVRNVAALQRELPTRHPAASATRQCYLMAPVLLELLQKRMASGDAAR